MRRFCAKPRLPLPLIDKAATCRGNMAGQNAGMGGAGASSWVPGGQAEGGQGKKETRGLFILPIAGCQGGWRVCWQKRLQRQQSPCCREQTGHQPSPSTRAGQPLVLLPVLEPTTPHRSLDRWKRMLREGSTTSCTPRPRKGWEYLGAASGGNVPSLSPSLTPVPMEEGGRSRP